MTIQLLITSCIYTRAAWFVERGGSGSRKKNTDKGKGVRCPLNGRCGGPHSRSGRFLEEENDSCHCQESSHDSPVVLTQSLHLQRHPSTAINRCSLRGISTDGKDTNLQLRALHALHATNTTKRHQSHSNQESKSNSNCNSPILQRVTGSLHHRISVHCLETINYEYLNL
jgi:hypothetical protein